MDLITALRATETLTDLPALVSALGHEPLWEEIPADRWLNRVRWHREVRRLAVAGRSGQWLWHGIETETPETIAPRLGEWMSRRGRQGGVLALDPERRVIVVSVSADPAPTLLVPLDAPDRFAITTLRRAAANSRPGPLEQSLHIADALGHRRMDRIFFEALRRSHERLAAAFEVPDREAAGALALLQLTRILFLYFIQAKGWLDGREDFLARTLDDSLRRGRHPQRDLLNPLFFGTLNRPAPERSAATRRFGRIPFLNGGLFEPHPLERRWKAEAPASLWREIFDELFERFHFTVTEGGETGIAPDMLGRAFEELMSPDARRATGTFYTPPALVTRLVDAGLTALVSSRLDLPAQQAERLLADPDHRTRKLLRAVTLLDPAAGSGAFLLGALERLSGLASATASSKGGRAQLTAVRRTVLQHNIFGVDLSATAVRLAELRLWLAVVRDDPAGPGDPVEPLPNLDCTVRQGDSLRDPLPRLGITGGESKALATARSRAMLASGGDKRSAAAELRREERRAADALLSAVEHGLEHTIAECLADARSPTLLDDRRGVDREIALRLATSRRDRSTVRHIARRLRREGELPWFHYQAHFADIFARGGFDLVMGNPPWVRAESLPPRTRQELAQRYRWWSGAGGRGFSHQGDLSLAFVERALELAAPGGAVSLLLPAKVATAGYAARARAALGSEHSVQVLADLSSDPDARFGATVYPLALVVAKRAPRGTDQIRTALAEPGRTIPQTSLATRGPWLLTGANVRTITEKLRSRFPALADRVPPQLGVKTGHNRAFLDPPEGLAPALVRWALRGREITPFAAHPSGRMLWTHGADGDPLISLPPEAARHLAPWRDELGRRTDCRSGPWWQLFRVRPSLGQHRVVWPDIARQLTAAPLVGRPDVIPLNSCYLVPAPSAEATLALAAWLNSRPIGHLARLGADPAQGGFARFNARTVGSVPWPDLGRTDRTLITLAQQGIQGEDTTRALDARVGEILELDARDLRTLAEDTDHRR